MLSIGRKNKREEQCRREQNINKRERKIAKYK